MKARGERVREPPRSASARQGGSRIRSVTDTLGTDLAASAVEREAERVGRDFSAQMPRVPLADVPRPNGRGDARTAVDSGIRSPARPLDAETRGVMERHFGRDFSDVRVHTEASASASAAAIQARAFAAGRDVVFAAGQYAPHTSAGRALLAHELTHVVQQRGVDRVAGRGVPVRHRVPAGVVARAAAESAAASPPATAEPVDRRDYDRLAEIIFKAIEGWGTDEEAVYHALEVLDREPPAIEKLKTTYAAKYRGHDLVADIRDDFSGSELEFALQLINLGDPKSAQRIEATLDASEAGLARAAQRLNDAFEVFLGTDEEAIFATLLPFKRDQNGLTNLRSVYQRNFHESLKDRIFDELSGTELDFALFLFLTPQEAYEHYLLQASKELSGGIRGGRSIGSGDVNDPDAKFDRQRWTVGNPPRPHQPEALEAKALLLNPDVRPSEAVQKLYDSMTQAAPFAYLFGRWRADCAEWVQVHHLYAALKVLGPARFDQRFGGGKEFWFKPQRSTVVSARRLWVRESVTDRMKPIKLEQGQPRVTGHDSNPVPDPNQPDADAEELLKQAPIGSRVAWMNRAIFAPSESKVDVVGRDLGGFRFENTIKLGPDLFGAHGFGPTVNMTRKEVEERLRGKASHPHLTDEENVFIAEIEIYRTVADEPRQ